MASGMKDLIDRDCGGSNPLMKVASHVLRDQAFRQEGIGGRLNHPDVKSGIPLHSATEKELVEEFMAEQMSALHARAPTTFSMHDLMREMRGIEGPAALHSNAIAHRADAKAGGDWVGQFLDEAEAASQQSDWSTEYMRAFPQNTYGDWSSGQYSSANHTSDKWAADYLDHTEQTDQTEWSQDLDLSQEDKNWLDSYHQMTAAENQTELDRVENKLEQSSGKTTADEWVDDYDSIVNTEFWNNMQRQWEEGYGGGDSEYHPWISDYDSYQKQYQEYKFEEENALRDHPDPFTEGLERLKLGDIPNAVLLFEAAAQKNPELSEVWQYLGTTQADNEQESLAIAALNKCLELDGGNLTALLSLAVSYTNEMQQQAACDTLLRWLRSNSKYSHLVGPDLGGADGFIGTTFTQVKDLFIQAACEGQTSVDADVQACLGVLFNISGEYDKAVDCFKTALQVRPEDWLLWNKLGATLANGKRSEESVESYHQALRLCPGYIKKLRDASFGLKVLTLSILESGIRRDTIKTFSEFFLRRSHEGSEASSVTRSKVTVMSSNIWSTLRMCLSMLSRSDLHTACDTHDLDTLNKEFNIDPLS